MKRIFMMCALAVSFAALRASADPGSGETLEGMHDRHGKDFGEYGSRREGSVVKGSGGFASRKLTPFKPALPDSKAAPPPSRGAGSEWPPAAGWVKPAGYGAIGAGALMFGLIAASVLPAGAVGAAAFIAFAGLMAVLYPWK